jgi:hypothetical protein
LKEVVALCPPRQQIHIILDNLSAHKTALVRQSLEQNPRVCFHFTPTYSSWLNQVELWFAKIERDVIARGVFTSVPDLARRLRRYINAYSANARPIRWKYSETTRRIPSNELSATRQVGARSEMADGGRAILPPGEDVRQNSLESELLQEVPELGSVFQRRWDIV